MLEYGLGTAKKSEIEMIMGPSYGKSPDSLLKYVIKCVVFGGSHS